MSAVEAKATPVLAANFTFWAEKGWKHSKSLRLTSLYEPLEAWEIDACVDMRAVDLNLWRSEIFGSSGHQF